MNRGRGGVGSSPVVAVTLAFLAATGLPMTTAAGGEEIREPAVAGRFYPASARALRGAVEGYLADSEQFFGENATGPSRSDAPPLAILAPHAGYAFSGAIAADAWWHAANHAYDLIVLLGTNHTTAGFRGVSVYDGDGYRTPLGVARIDRAAAARLRDADRDFVCRRDVHVREHSVEVQVPFAQVLFPGVPLVTAIVGAPDPDLCDRLGAAIAALAADRRVLVVASSDLSHYPSCEAARRVDRTVLERGFLRGRDTLREVVREEEARGTAGLSTCACGLGPLLAAMAAAEYQGPVQRCLISYANSGDTALGEAARVVGYGAALVRRGSPPHETLPAVPPGGDGVPNAAERQRLLAFARESIRRYLTTETAPLARGLGAAAEQPHGAFVTLKLAGELRGCIGHMTADRPLGQVVGAMALQAAFGDRRFTPVSLPELAQIEVEISVLTPYEPIADPAAIRLGVDGVLLVKDGRSAVFLPQVATEQGWNRDELLTALCRKAGLPADAWREGATLSIFQAVVFGESDAP